MKKVALAIGILIITSLNFKIYHNFNININLGTRVLLNLFGIGLIVFSLYDQLNLKNVTRESVKTLFIILLINASLEVILYNHDLPFFKSVWGVLNDLIFALLALIFIKREKENKNKPKNIE